MAGASGLLAILFPEDFGTVDQFVVENLWKIPEYLPSLPEKGDDNKINISLTHAVFMVTVFREKADELNRKFRSDYWTPRRIDMALWGTRGK